MELIHIPKKRHLSWIVVTSILLLGASCTNEQVANNVTINSSSVISNVNSQPKNTFTNGKIDIVNKLATRTAFNKTSFDFSTVNDGASRVIIYRGNASIGNFPIVDSKTSGTVTLEEGINTFNFRLADDLGGLSEIKNSSEITLQTTPPTIYTSCNVSTGAPTFITTPMGEWACVEIGSATGPQYGSASLPIHGAVSSTSVSVTINGKRLMIGNGDFYINQKVSLPVSLGTNIYEIVAKDDLGNQSKDRVNFEWVDTSKSTQVTPDSTDDPGCCKVCTTGKACGNSCISRSYTCHKAPGCACDG